MNIEETKAAIAALPNNGRLEIYAGGRDDVKTGLTTMKIKALVDDHTALKERLAGYDKMFETVSIADIGVNRFYKNAQTRKWAQMDSLDEYDTICEAWVAALQGEAKR